MQTFSIPVDPGLGITTAPSTTSQMLNPPNDRVLDVFGVDASLSILTENLSEETLMSHEPTLLASDRELSATFNRASGDEAIYSSGRQFAAPKTNWFTSNLIWATTVARVNRPIDLGEVGLLSSSLADESFEAFALSNGHERLSGELFDDEALLDIAEVLDDRLGSQPRRLRISDRDVEKEPADDYLPTNSGAPHDWNELGWILHQLDHLESPDRDVADQSRDMADQGPAVRREGAEGGMIELSHFHSPLHTPFTHGAIAVVGAANADGISSVEFVKTDSSCARYQAFELASRLVDPTSTDPTLDEGSGESIPSANLSPTNKESTPDDNSLDTDTRARNASSSIKAPAASALLAGFFWRRRWKRGQVPFVRSTLRAVPAKGT